MSEKEYESEEAKRATVILYRLSHIEERVSRLEVGLERSLARLDESVQKLITKVALVEFRTGVWRMAAGVIMALAVAYMAWVLEGHK